MNQLNSIIIEGDVSEVGKITTGNTGIERCEVTIKTKRFYKNSNGENCKEESFFVVVGKGGLANRLATLSKNNIVRVVGRLKQEQWKYRDKECSRVVIISDHIEILI